MYSWVNDYVGIPYVCNGRTVNGFDCYGLVSDIYKKQLNIELPDWLQKGEGSLNAIRSLTEHVTESVEFDFAYSVKTPVDFDIAVLHKCSTALHVGLYICGGILHSASSNGSCTFESEEQFMALTGIEIKYYRWRKAGG